jgi:hypothetical protein
MMRGASASATNAVEFATLAAPRLILLFPNRLARDPHQVIGMSALDIAHP